MELNRWEYLESSVCTLFLCVVCAMDLDEGDRVDVNDNLKFLLPVFVCLSFELGFSDVFALPLAN